MCGLDPVPNLHPERRAMEPAGYPHWKITKRTERETINKRSPKNRAHWLIVVRELDQSQISYTPKYYSSSRGTLPP
jgi:hypothetical protein